MATNNVHVDDELEAFAILELELLDATPSESICQAQQYVVEPGEWLFWAVEEDEKLIATVSERLAAPQRVKVKLDDLE